MNKNESSHVSMHGKSSNLIDENPPKFASNPTTPEAKSKLDQGIADEKQIAQKQDELKHSSNEPKIEAHNATVVEFYQIGSKITSYAYDNHNLELLSKVSITLSDMQKLPDNVIISRCETILSCGEQYLPQLAAYSVTAQTLTDGNNVLNALKLEIKKQGQRKIDLTSVTAQLKKQISITDKLLEPFDTMVETLRFSDPVWYNVWWDARSVPHSATARVSAIVKVFDAETNQPLPGAILTYHKIDAKGKALTSGADMVKNVKIKSAGGGVDLKSFTTGAYLFTVSYAGRADQQTTVYINEGILTRVNFPLSKIA